MPPTPSAAAGAPKCDFDRMTTDATTKITASTGKVQPLERLHQVVSEEGESSLQQHDDDQSDQRREPEQCGQRVGAADAVGGEPADPGGHRHQHRRHRISLEPERKSAEHHLRHTVQWPARGQEVVRDRAKAGADDDAERLPARRSCRRRRRTARRRRPSRTPDWARSKSRTAGLACRGGPPRRCIRCRPVLPRRSDRGRCRRSGRWVRSLSPSYRHPSDH